MIKLLSFLSRKFFLIISLLAAFFVAPLSHSTGEIYHGVASFYHDSLDGNRTACGQIFRQNKMTAAHKTLPCGTKVLVTRSANNRSVEVVINDRGPFIKGRIIDLSRSAARELRMERSGIARISMEILEYGDGKYRKE